MRSSFSINVCNIPPKSVKKVPEDELKLFQKYMLQKTGKAGLLPFEHQAIAFDSIKQNKNITLVAGTAAGKTLAVAIPIFAKLLKNKIQKVMFLYPTIALMEDQLSVLKDLMGTAGLDEEEMGYIHGNMTRSKLMYNLSKKIIVATPDAIYWFFRKNIKYNSLLIYGLCQVDEFVLDEAHVFTGLSLHNLKLFFERIQLLQKQYMSKTSRLHVLTATPREEVFSLNNGCLIKGRSKCKDVLVKVFNSSPFERLQDFEHLMNKAIDKNYKKVIILMNSAIAAHRLFLAVTEKKTHGAFLPEHYIQFGRIKKTTLEEYLVASGFSKEQLQCLYYSDDAEYRFKDFEIVNVVFHPEELFNTFKDIFLKYRGKINQVLYFTFKKRENLGFEHPLSWKQLEDNLNRRNTLLVKLLSTIEAQWGDTEKNYFEWKKEIEEVFDRALEKLQSEIDNISSVVIDYPSMRFFNKVLNFVDNKVKEDIKKRFSENVKFKKTSILNYKGRFPKKRGEYIYLKWLKSYFEEDFDDIYKALTKMLDENPKLQNQIEMSHVGFFKDTDWPVIVYSGSMARSSRKGLINLYDDLDKAILISTSAVEVGVDFSADLLITEKCEAGSFLQRFGRVGRSTEKSECWILVDGNTFADLKEECQLNTEITREQFTEIIQRTFKTRTSLSSSALLETGYFLLNQQLGLVGEEINNSSKISAVSKDIALKFKETGLTLLYGLRGTLPSISLKDEGVTKNLFQLLQYVPNEALECSGDGFELARSDTYFKSLLYRKKAWEVFVDVERTVNEGKAAFLIHNDKLNIYNEENKCKEMYNFVSQLKADPDFDHPYLLMYGDIYLKRKVIDDDSIEITEVCDKYGEPIVIKDQFCMIFPGMTDLIYLSEKGLNEMEELFYDVDFFGRSKNGKDLVILDNIQGACLSLYMILRSFSGWCNDH